MTACSIPSRRSEYETCSPPGPEPIDDDRILARRERAASAAGRQLRHRFAARSRRACAWSIRYITWGWSTRNGSTRGPARTRQRSWRVAIDVGDRRHAEEDRHLAEEVAAAEACALLAVDLDDAPRHRR